MIMPAPCANEHRIVVVPSSEQGIEPVALPVSPEDLVLSLVQSGLVDQQTTRFSGNQPAPHLHAHLVVFERVRELPIPDVRPKLGCDAFAPGDVRPDGDVSVFPVALFTSGTRLAKHRVDTAHHVADLPRDLEEYSLAHSRICLSAGASTERFKSFMTFI